MNGPHFGAIWFEKPTMVDAIVEIESTRPCRKSWNRTNGLIVALLVKGGKIVWQGRSRMPGAPSARFRPSHASAGSSGKPLGCCRYFGGRPPPSVFRPRPHGASTRPGLAPGSPGTAPFGVSGGSCGWGGHSVSAHASLLRILEVTLAMEFDPSLSVVRRHYTNHSLCRT